MLHRLILSSLLKHALFGLIHTAHVLVSQSRAAEGLLAVLAVTLENFGLQVSADWVNLIPLELCFHLFSSFLVLFSGDFVELGAPLLQSSQLLFVERILLL